MKGIALTTRSVILGLLWAFFLSAFTFFNDKVMGGNELTGQFVPFGVFGVTVVLAVVINPLFRRLRGRELLSSSELAVSTALALFACFVPGRGLMQYFNSTLMMPHYYAGIRAGWHGDPAAVGQAQISDWELLFKRAQSGLSADAPALLKEVVERFPDEVRARLENHVPDSAAEDETGQALLSALNSLITGPADWRAISADRSFLPRYLVNLLRRPADSLSAKEKMCLNRGILDIVFSGCLTSRRPGPLECAPPAMLADVPPDDDGRILNGFVVGLGEGGKSVAIGDIPWRAWRRPLLFWCPLLLALGAMVIGLAAVCHRQWVDHEHLAYPTVQFLRDLFPGSEGGTRPLLQERGFWIGLLVVVLINLNNYAARWWPEYLISVPSSFDFRALRVLCPVIHTGWGTGLFRPQLFFAAIGFAFLLSTHVSFSIGIAPWLYWLVVGTLATYGVNVSAGYATFTPGIQPSLHAGAYLAMFAVLLYSGRRHYLSVLQRAFLRPGLRHQDDGPGTDYAKAHEIWGARSGLIGFLMFVLLLRAVGLPLWLGAAYALGAVTIYTVISRLLAEGGVFSLQSCWYPGALLWGIFGARALGPDRILVMGIVSSLLLVTYREALMPHAMSALRLTDRVAPIGRLAACGGAVFALALAVAIPTTLYLQYVHGALRTSDLWTCDRVPAAPYENDVAIRLRLQSQGFDAAMAEGKDEDAVAVSPDWSCVGAVAFTFGLVLVFTFLRRRLPWWPLHPLLFLVMGTNDAVTFSASFLIGWGIKAATFRYGGWAAYQRVKPVMVGCISGAMVAGLLTAVFGVVYYVVTDTPPIQYRVF